MGIFDFFKKKGKENVVEGNTIEKLAFSDIESWIKKKIKENEAKEKEIISMIMEKIRESTIGIREKIVVLELFDVELKKENERIKELVKSSRKDYIETVENLLERLNHLETNDFQKFMERIEKLFFEFNKISHKNYERATVLIGKEMASIKKGVKVFSTEILKTYDEKSDVVNFSKKISLVKSKLKIIDSIDEILKKINKTEIFLNKKIGIKEEENKNLSEEMEKIKNSSDYLDFLDSQKKVESLKLKSRGEILGLKQLIDFKSLANFFHINQKQMKIVKDHKEDFYTFFLENDGKSIISLLDEANLNKNEILEKTKRIFLGLEKIKDYEKKTKKDEIKELDFKVKETSSEIDNLKIEQIKEEKRKEKLEMGKQESINVLKKELSPMNVELTD